jgi:hypothetical protein
VLVDVYRLRREGVKLDPAAVKASQPVRGDLRYSGYKLKDGVFYDAVLKSNVGANGASSIPDLTRAALRKIKGQNLLFHGTEMIGEVAFNQAWWCVVVAG